VALTVGTHMRSTRSTAEVVVVRATDADAVLELGGAPMAPDAAPDGAAPEPEGALTLGKRYAAEDAGVEVLCVKPGPGSLTVGGVPLQLKSAKLLPASD